ncbi:MAG: TerD family protein [Candidatus Accumulibacter sp. UW26]|jgi:tellurite resistance protein TerA
MEISRGQRVRIDQLIAGSPRFTLQVDVPASGLTIDFSCFGLDGAGKLADERYMIFFNQPLSPCGGLSSAGESGRFSFDLDRLPATVERIVLTAAIDGSGTMGELGNGVLTITPVSGALSRFAFGGADFARERALMLAEIYRKDGSWRFCATAQGFNGGLAALVQHFGGMLAASSPEPVPAPAPAKVSLSKITLEKRGDKVSLEKRGSGIGHGRIVCNLNWRGGSAPGAKSGLLGGLFGRRRTSGIDLDLGCLFEMANGTKGAVQALGNSFGAYDRPPFIHMTGDDRTGENAAGEFLYVNGDHLAELRRICIYAFIYEGAANWGQARGVVTVSVPGHQPVEVCLDGHDDRMNMGAIAMLENDRGELRVTKLAEYFAGHRELDQRYGWGLRYQAGAKS